MKRRTVLKSTALMIAGAALGGESLARQVDVNVQEDQFLDRIWATFRNRRSVRKFKPTPIPPEHIRTIVDMARTAPSSGNQQPWKFLIIQDRTKLDELKNALIEKGMERVRSGGAVTGEKLETEKKNMTRYFEDYLSAPVAMIVMTDDQSKYPDYNHHDGPLAAGYLMLAARFLGYGTVYATDSINPDVARKLFHIPERYRIVCSTPVGIPDRWPDPPSKKPLDDFIVRDSF